MHTNDPHATAGQPPEMPRKKHHFIRWILAGTGSLVLLIIILNVATAGGGASNSGAAPAPQRSTSAPATQPPSSQASSTQPPATQPPATVAPATQPPAPASPAAAPADVILARFRGTGSGSTGMFTVPADGNWHLSWAFMNGTAFAGQTENFIVSEYTADGQMVPNGAEVNALVIGNGTPTASPVYGDPAAGQQVYFKVITEDASWELVPVSGTS